MLAACRTGLRCVSAHLRAALPTTTARSGAARAARRGWIGGCHRRDCLVAAAIAGCTRAALLILPRAADRRRSGWAWWRQTARARWISRATCSCAGAPRRHLIAWLRLLSIDLQLDGAMSSPGPAAKLALKRQTGLMGGDMGLAATTAAAQAQSSVAAAQPAAAAAAAATGAYDLQAMARASQSLPVVPARSSTTGRPVAPHPFFVAGRDRRRGRGRGSPQQWCSQQRWRRRRRQRQRRRWPQQPQ